MRRLRIDIGGHDVRLDLVTLDTCPCPGVVNGIDKRKYVSGLISITKGCEGNHRPGGGVGVLATIFPDAGRIALDVTRIKRCVVEGRCKEQSQPGVATD